jgi:GNAT superfamily N-acetyltransferase
MMSIRTSVADNELSRSELAELGITEESLERMLASSHAGWCAEVEGRVVGFSMVDRERSTVFALFVRPGFEGRGAGTVLLEAAVAYLSAAGHERVTLTTGPETRAFGFYRARGWQQTGFDEQGEAELELRLR